MLIGPSLQTPSPLQMFPWALVALPPPRGLLSLNRTNTQPSQSWTTSSNPLLFKVRYPSCNTFPNLPLMNVLPFSTEPVFSDPAPSFPEPQPPVPPTADLFQVFFLALIPCLNPSFPVPAGDWGRRPHTRRCSFWCSRARFKWKSSGKLGS